MTITLIINPNHCRDGHQWLLLDGSGKIVREEIGFMMPYEIEHQLNRYAEEARQ